MKKLLIVDGNSLLHRAYHGYPPLTTAKGELVGAVYGFSLMLFTAIDKLEPNYVTVAWDVGKKTFRHDKYAEYKAGRAKTDQELIDQIGRVKEVVTALAIPQIGVVNFEADDIIGTVAERVKEQIDQVIIMTGDRDALQLVDGKKVVVYMPSAGKWAKDKGIAIYDEEGMIMKYGFTPAQVPDWKGLVGDSSDNIIGVKGIGEVSAKKILAQVKTVEELYDKLEDLDLTPRIKELLRTGKESAFLSKEIATIDRKMPLDFVLEDCRLEEYDRDLVTQLFEQLQFKTLINRLPKDKKERELEEIFQ